jgi:hypothetical protein
MTDFVPPAAEFKTEVAANRKRETPFPSKVTTRRTGLTGRAIFIVEEPGGSME